MRQTIILSLNSLTGERMSVTGRQTQLLVYVLMYFMFDNTRDSTVLVGLMGSQ